MSNMQVLQGDARETLPTLDAGSVHMAVTSPPYWALRSYLPKDHPLKSLELGSESTPELYVENLVGVFDHVKRVLRDDGVIFVNLGDTYSASAGQRKKTDSHGDKQCTNVGSITDSPFAPDLEAGSRVLIPERFALAMQANGWLLRDVIIWHKLSPMPSSVDGWRWSRHRVKVKSDRGNRDVKAAVSGNHRAVASFKDERTESGRALSAEGRAEWIDCPGCAKCSPNDGLILSRGSWRTTCSHETIFMFAKRMNYFCDAEAVAEEATSATVERNQYSRVNDDADEQFAVKHDHEFVGLTRNPRSVRNFKASFYAGKHYAAFPISIPEWCIRAGTSAHGVCAECGAPWARITEKTNQTAHDGNTDTKFDEGSTAGRLALLRQAARARGEEYATGRKSIGWRATCNCDAKFIPATVLDPFGGTGTTAQAVISLGRRAVMCELNPEYVAQIEERINGSVPLLAGFAGDAGR